MAITSYSLKQWGYLLACIFSLSLVPTTTQNAIGDTPTQIACIGDSITYGQGLSNPIKYSYPSVLLGLLGTNYKVGNFGVSGAAVLHSVDLQYRAQAAYVRALKFNPDTLIVGLGTNDSKYVFDAQRSSDFVSDYEDLIASFRRINPNVRVYVFLPIPSYPKTRQENVTLKTVILPLIQQVAQDTGSQLIDLNTPFTHRPELYHDGYHPNEQGASFLASQVYASINPTPAPTSAGSK